MVDHVEASIKEAPASLKMTQIRKREGSIVSFDIAVFDQVHNSGEPVAQSHAVELGFTKRLCDASVGFGVHTQLK